MKLPNKIYDVLKWVLTLFVPALISLIMGLGAIYHFDTEVIVATISVIATFLGAIFGISNVNYNKEKGGEADD